MKANDFINSGVGPVSKCLGQSWQQEDGNNRIIRFTSPPLLQPYSAEYFFRVIPLYIFYGLWLLNCVYYLWRVSLACCDGSFAFGFVLANLCIFSGFRLSTHL